MSRLGFSLAGVSMLLLSQALLAAEDKTAPALPVDNMVKLASIGIFLLILLGFVGYMFYLQRRYMDSCRQEHQLELFSNSPAGLPAGTVRAMLALMIVTLSLYFIVISYMGLIAAGQTLPEALTAVLGTVLGFYFGSRSAPASGSSSEAGSGQVAGFKRERDEAQNQQTDSRILAARKVVSTGKLLGSFLPEAWAKKAAAVTTSIESGIDKVEQLQQIGDAVGALSESANTIKQSPVGELFSKAASAFSGPLGAAVPQVALVAAIVAMGSRFAGSAYQKWKSRVLHAPFSPALVRISPVDSNTGFMLIMQSSVFKRAFAPELAAGDNPFLAGFANQTLEASSLEGLWESYRVEYGTRFDSQAEFVEAAESLRRGAVDRELQRLAGEGVAADAGGYEGVVKSIDRLYTDPEAEAELHALFTTIEKLQREGHGDEINIALEQLRETK